LIDHSKEELLQKSDEFLVVKAEKDELECRLKDTASLMSNYKLNYESLEGEFCFLKEKISAHETKINIMTEESELICSQQ